MNTHKIAVIAGDGIGPEVIDEGVKVLDAAAWRNGSFRFEFTHFPWGCEYYLREGRMMPEDALETLKGFDAIFLGAVGSPGVPDHVSLRDLLLEIRHGFDQYVNVRPVKLLKGAPCPLAGVKREDIDMVFIRENSEGEYAGLGEWRGKGTPDEALPSVYDETHVLPGSEIGECVALARRRGSTWFLAVENGAVARSLTVDLGFLAGKTRMIAFGDAPDRLDAFVKTEREVSPGERLALEIRPCGGFVAMLTDLAKTER